MGIQALREAGTSVLRLLASIFLLRLCVKMESWLRPGIVAVLILAFGAYLVWKMYEDKDSPPKPRRACIPWSQAVEEPQLPTFLYSCPEKYRVGNACVVHGTIATDWLCESRGVVNDVGSGAQCYRANLAFDAGDGQVRSMTAATFDTDKDHALSKILQNRTMGEGVYYDDPGWCEYIDDGKSVWGSLGLYDSDFLV
jgi:hypothetical protein